MPRACALQLVVTYGYVHDSLHEVVIVEEDSIGVDVSRIEIVCNCLRAVEERVVKDLHENSRVPLESSA